MKTRNIFIWIMLLIMGLTACSEEEVNTYSADEGIYFNQRIRVGNILTDSTNFTFVYIEESQNEATVSIPVQLVGRATDEPRPVNIKVVGGSPSFRVSDSLSAAIRYISPNLNIGIIVFCINPVVLMSLYL